MKRHLIIITNRMLIRQVAIVVISCVMIPSGVFAQANKPANTSVPPATRPVNSFSAYPAGTPASYIRTWEPLRPLTDPGSVTSYPDAKDIKQSTEYVDGLGRPLQMITKGFSANSKKDVVVTYMYDEFGREKFKYLPYVSTASDGQLKFNPFTEQSQFSDTQYGNETIFYSEAEFEKAPMGRLLKMMAPGNSWAGNGRGVTNRYEINTLEDDVKIWDIGPGDYPVAHSEPYPAGQLYKLVITNESGGQVIEYKDKEDQLILRKMKLTAVADGHSGWLCTYYVYNQFGSLRYVLPPKAVEVLEGNGWSLADATLRKELCFNYIYDHRGRMISKQMPGAETTEMVYDVLDRLVFSRDGNLRAQGKWLATLYDEVNRPVMTGFYTTSETAAQLQTALNTPAAIRQITHSIPAPVSLTVNHHDGRPFYKATEEIIFNDGFDTGDDGVTETELGSGTTLYTETIYASNSLSSLDPSRLDPLTYSYYDNYSYEGKKDPVSVTMGAPIGSPHADDRPISQQTKGLLTGNKVKVLGGSNQWLTATTYYDVKGRIRQVISDNIAGGENITTNLYNFNGQVLNEHLIQRNPRSVVTPEVDMLTKVEYNHNGQLLRVNKQLKDLDAVDIATYAYNELGQLEQKTFKKSDGSTLESLTYDYNIRGWVSSINRRYFHGDNSHYFSEELNYDHGFDVPQYSGNIAGIKWKGANDTAHRAYGFAYDATNRLMKADFTQFTAGSWNKNAGIDYDVKMGDGITPTLAYDGNGNIKRMQQSGFTGTASIPVDDMRYSYANNNISNKLKEVTDEVYNPSSTLGDFKEITKGEAEDYSYDANGNMLRDGNKGISQISYNHLNLPDLITMPGKGTIRFEYDANGVKHRKTVTDQSGSATKIITTSYIGGIVYEQDSLQSISHEEGRVRMVYTNGEPVQYTYDYFVKDHLGNIRVVLTEQTQQNLYLASMEEGRSAVENALFSNIESSRSAKPAGYPQESSAGTDNRFVAKLNGNNPDKRIGPSLVLRVMRGDTISIGARAFYKSLATKQNKSPLPASDMVSALISAFGGFLGSGGDKVSAGQPGARSPFSQQFINNQYKRLRERESGNQLNDNRPRAYLNFALFDDQFNLVEENSGVKQVQAQPDQLQTLAKDKMVIKKGGFLYVYTSNETPQDVFFDNVVIMSAPGPVLEETHYYPFGLVMDGISYKTLGKLENKYLYNGKELQHNEFSDNSGLDWYDYGARMYDPQIGRWMVKDPLSEISRRNSPYNYTANNPIRFIDPDGMKKEETEGGVTYTGQEAIDLFKKLKAGNGFEPTRRNAVGVRDMIAGLGQRNGGAGVTSLGQLEETWDNVPAGSPRPAPLRGRYLYSEKWGWIDMRHFSSSAESADTWSGSAKRTLDYGYAVEVTQAATFDESAFDYEDLVSNLLGVGFEAYLETSVARDRTLLQNLESYLRDLGFVDAPERHAPNYMLIAENNRGEGTGPQNKTYQPLHAPKANERNSYADKLVLGVLADYRKQQRISGTK